MPSVVFDSVRKTFRRTAFPLLRRNSPETFALKDISLQVAQGEVLALLGPNGSGKSTTLKLIATVLLPDGGKVLVHGADTLCEANRVRRDVGFALASERSFFPRLTVRENLDFFAALENIRRPERALRIGSILHELGMEQFSKHQVMKLSSGWYQRLAIARALIKRPRVLLLDEPSRSLDPAAANHLWEIVRSLADRGITILLATHSFAEAVATAHRIAVLEQGTLLATQPTFGLSGDTLQDYYLDLTGERRCAWVDEVPA